MDSYDDFMREVNRRYNSHEKLVSTVFEMITTIEEDHEDELGERSDSIVSSETLKVAKKAKETLAEIEGVEL